MRILVRVIANLSPSKWRVIVGPGVGMLNGGAEQDWPEEWIPASARFPNCEFAITGYQDGVPQVIEVGSETQQSAAYTERRLPATHRGTIAGVVAGFFGLTLACVSLGLYLDNRWITAAPFFIAVPTGWFFFNIWRCPECSQRLVDIKDFIGERSTYRVLLRCRHCQVDWDTGLYGDTKYDNS